MDENPKNLTFETGKELEIANIPLENIEDQEQRNMADQESPLIDDTTIRARSASFDALLPSNGTLNEYENANESMHPSLDRIGHQFMSVSVNDLPEVVFTQTLDAMTNSTFDEAVANLDTSPVMNTDEPLDTLTDGLASDLEIKSISEFRDDVKLTRSKTLTDDRSPVSPSSVYNFPISFASDKRNVDFHLLFRSAPDSDRLIEDYSCAYQREILVHGRMFITQSHLCFNSNIFGWITNLVISFKDILSIERRMSAFVIPNAILVTTLHSKYFFTSFMAREQSYSVLVRLWKAALGETVSGLPFSPSLKSTTTVEPSTSGDEADVDRITNYAPSISSLPLPREFNAASSPKKRNFSRSFIADDVGMRRFSFTRRPRRKTVAKEVTIPQGSPKLNRSESVSDSGILNPEKKKTKKMWKAKFLDELVLKVSRSSLDDLSTGGKSDGLLDVATKSDTLDAGYEQSEDEDLSGNERPTNPIRQTTLTDFPSKYKRDSVQSQSKAPIFPKKQDSLTFPRSTKKTLSQRNSTLKAPTIALKPPKPPTFCNCRDHCKSKVIDRIFPIPISSMAAVLYGSGSFFEKVCASLGFVDIFVGSWEKAEGVEKRKIQYGVPLKFPFAPKYTQCTILHRYTRKEANSVYCVREAIHIPNVPGGSSFRSISSQCIMRVGDHETRLIVAFEVEFLKTTWLRGPLEKNAIEGNLQFWREFEQMLVVECEDLAMSPQDLMPKTHELDQTQKKEHVHAPTQEKLKPIQVIDEKADIYDLIFQFGRFVYLALLLFIQNNFFSVILPSLTAFLIASNLFSLNRIWRLENKLESIVKLPNDFDIHQDNVFDALSPLYNAPKWWFEEHSSDVDMPMLDRNLDIDEVVETHRNMMKNIFTDLMASNSRNEKNLAELTQNFLLKQSPQSIEPEEADK